MTIARKIFVAWMKERGEWHLYQQYINKHIIERKYSWESPKYPNDFLGRNRYTYKTYKDWCNFYDTIVLELKKAFYTFYL